jgi:hypothetical protein
MKKIESNNLRNFHWETTSGAIYEKKNSESVEAYWRPVIIFQLLIKLLII